MSVLHRVALSILATVAATAMAFGLSPVATAEPMGPCQNVVYVGVCEPVKDRSTPPPRQSRGEVNVLPQQGAGLIG